MKKTLLAVAAAMIALTAATGTPALAQGWQPGPDDRGSPYQAQHQDRTHDRDDRNRDSHGPNAHNPAPRPAPHPVHRPDFRPGPPEGRGWHAGQRLPREWRAQRHVIAKPAAHHLRRPPPGHRWVRAGHDAVLIVSASGFIVQIVPGLFR
ncbi:RcnB family protein [Azospirillum sp. HJ39]|uniref:RcnB family protein n=1 Tax=Azospirillum sp. HJ39 TaxID=3159496 RepID=UPI003557E011